MRGTAKWFDDVLYAHRECRAGEVALAGLGKWEGGSILVCKESAEASRAPPI